MANPYPRVVRDLADILIVEVKRVHQLAVDIDLELRGCTIADSHWSGSAISFPMVQDHLGNLFRAVAGIHNGSLDSRGRLRRGVISNPTHKAGSVLQKPDSKKSVTGERGIAKPRISVIPIPAAADNFGEARGRRRNYRAGGLEGKKLQGQRGSVHLFAPATAVGAGRKPGLPEFHCALKQLFRFSVRGRRAGAGVLFTVTSKGESLGFSFLEDELSGDSAFSVLHERQGRGESQAQIFRPERSTMGIDHSLMVLSSVIESRAASQADADRTFDAPDPAIKMVVPGRIGRKAHRHEIHEFGDAVPVQESRDQNVGRRPVKLLVPDAFGERTNLESASLFVVQNRSENAGGVKIRETIPVNGAIYPHQRNGAHVADDSVIFDRLISHAIFSSDTASISSNL